MLYVATLAFPLVLLGLLLWMEWVERPLRAAVAVERLSAALESAPPDEVEELVTEGFDPALRRYWRRERIARLLPGRRIA